MNKMAVTSLHGAVTPAGDHLPAVPAFGNKANTVRFLTIPLDTAANGKRFAITGTRIKAVKASSLSANITVAFQEQGNGAFPMSKGSGIRGVHFDQLYITWAAQAGATITLLVAVEQQDKIEIDDAAEDYTSVSLAKPTTSGTAVDVTVVHGAAAVQVWAAVATGWDVLITNNGTVPVRIGDAATDATHGTPVGAGQEITLPATCDWYAYNGDGATDTTLCFSNTAD